MTLRNFRDGNGMSGCNEIYTPLINIWFNFRYKNFWVVDITISKSARFM